MRFRQSEGRVDVDAHQGQSAFELTYQGLQVLRHVATRCAPGSPKLRHDGKALAVEKLGELLGCECGDCDGFRHGVGDPMAGWPVGRRLCRPDSPDKCTLRANNIRIP